MVDFATEARPIGAASLAALCGCPWKIVSEPEPAPKREPEPEPAPARAKAAIARAKKLEVPSEPASVPAPKSIIRRRRERR